MTAGSLNPEQGAGFIPELIQQVVFPLKSAEDVDDDVTVVQQ